jgi:hypothetical protein
MGQFWNGAAKPVLLAGLLLLAGCVVAPSGPDYGYGAAPGYSGPGYYGYYGYYDAPGFEEPGHAGAFCCFGGAHRRHEHDHDRHEAPQNNAVEHNPAAPRAVSGSSLPHPSAAPVVHAPPRAAAARAPGGAPAGHASPAHSASGDGGGSGPLHRE